MKFVHRFPVARGVQATREYYIAMVPLNMIGRLFTSDAEYIPPEYRAQRRLNEARIPVISKYILDNRNTYTFSALAASIDGAFGYTPSELNADVGILEISGDARFLINDGQHRKAAIMKPCGKIRPWQMNRSPLSFLLTRALHIVSRSSLISIKMRLKHQTRSRNSMILETGLQC